MILYADTSALVKKYVREAGSEAVLTYFAGFETTATAALTLIEMAAALTKAARMGWVDETASQKTWRDFLAHWPAYIRMPISAGVVERAARLAWTHGLRAYDAAHLACAQVCLEVVGEELVFACYDRRLRAAASAEGLRVWPEDDL
jgi:predicted nucleic acid-binding protein